ncbi:MAG: ferritin-like domain-containing protein [Thermomicrobiales bacterium]
MLRITQGSSRRALLGGGMAFTLSAAFFHPLAAAPVTDRELLALLIAVERVQIDRYDAILDAFDAAAFTATGFSEADRDRLVAAREAEATQRAALEGDDPVLPPPTAPTDLRLALGELAELENLAVATYAGAIPRIGRRGLLPELIGIQSVEARHAAWLAMLLDGDPFPAAIDEALPPGEALSQLQVIAGLAAPAATPIAAGDNLAAVVAAIAAELGVAASTVQVVAVEPRTWPDASLGCPEPGHAYAQVITPGYVVTINSGGKEMTFHTDQSGNIARC